MTGRERRLRKSTKAATEPASRTSTKSSGYADAFDTYHRLGWPVLKLKARTKYPPPKGYTGSNGQTPSYADMSAWAEEEPDGNIAIRLPADVIGIDVDDYGDKNGAATIAEAETRWGKLRYSPRSSARDDGKSGIRLYRIPEGVKLKQGIEFPELGLGGVEVCQHHHRYVMCWPSIHPNGGQYQWHGIDGVGEPPALADIPELPADWLEALTEATHNGTEIPPDAAYDVRKAITEGEPSPRVTRKLGAALTELFGPNCRHDEIRNHVLGLLRYGKNGEPGVKNALKALSEAFVNVVGPDRPGGRKQASREFREFVYRKTGEGTWVFREEVGKKLADDSYDDTDADSASAGPGEFIGESAEWVSHQPITTASTAMTPTIHRIRRRLTRLSSTLSSFITPPLRTPQCWPTQSVSPPWPQPV
jgi:bifunctional DNA primase/polymerase-like protein